MPEPPSVADIRTIAATLPRSYEVLVHDRIKFRVGRIVYLALSRDERHMGFAFPRDERQALVDAEPDKFLLPKKTDMRFNWVVVRLEQLNLSELNEIILAAWEMVVPKKIGRAHLGNG